MAHEIIALIAQYGLLLVFLNVLAAQAGVPVPAVPTLVVAGDKDDSRHFTDIGPEWHADPYRLAPAPKTLLTLFNAEHLLGGISGYDADETTDENPERVAALGRLTSAYLRTQFQPGDHAWQTACEALTTGAGSAGRVESK